MNRSNDSLQDLIKYNLETGAWERDNFFRVLLRHRVRKELPGVFDWLIERFHKGTQSSEDQFKAAICLAACAVLSTENEDDEARIKQILDQMKANTWDTIEQIHAPGYSSNSSHLYRTLDCYPWPLPFNTSWAWDAVSQFKEPQDPVCKEEIIITLVEEEGLLAKLTVEAFPGNGPDLVFFPDPRQMTFVKLMPEFQQSFIIGAGWAWELANSNGCSSADIRWQIDRLDEYPLNLIKGESVGPAFALAVAKVLYRFKKITHEQKAEEDLQIPCP